MRCSAVGAIHAELKGSATQWVLPCKEEEEGEEEQAGGAAAAAAAAAAAGGGEAAGVPSLARAVRKSAGALPRLTAVRRRTNFSRLWLAPASLLSLGWKGGREPEGGAQERDLPGGSELSGELAYEAARLLQVARGGESSARALAAAATEETAGAGERPQSEQGCLLRRPFLSPCCPWASLRAEASAGIPCKKSFLA